MPGIWLPYKTRNGSITSLTFADRMSSCFYVLLQIGLTSNRVWFSSKRWLNIPSSKNEICWKTKIRQGITLNDLSQWNNVITRDGSKFCETWSLYNLRDSLRKRIQNDKYKTGNESHHYFRIRKEMPTKHWRPGDLCTSVFLDLFTKFTNMIT